MIERASGAGSWLREAGGRHGLEKMEQGEPLEFLRMGGAVPEEIGGHLL